MPALLQARPPVPAVITVTWKGKAAPLLWPHCAVEIFKPRASAFVVPGGIERNNPAQDLPVSAAAAGGVASEVRRRHGQPCARIHKMRT